jgi:hypothetical protein
MTRGVVVATEDDDNDGWDLHPFPVADETATDVAMLLSPPVATVVAILLCWRLRGRWTAR